MYLCFVFRKKINKNACYDHKQTEISIRFRINCMSACIYIYIYIHVYTHLFIFIAPYTCFPFSIRYNLLSFSLRLRRMWFFPPEFLSVHYTRMACNFLFEGLIIPLFTLSILMNNNVPSILRYHDNNNNSLEFCGGERNGLIFTWSRLYKKLTCHQHARQSNIFFYFFEILKYE